MLKVLNFSIELFVYTINHQPFFTIYYTNILASTCLSSRFMLMRWLRSLKLRFFLWFKYLTYFVSLKNYTWNIEKSELLFRSEADVCLTNNRFDFLLSSRRISSLRTVTCSPLWNKKRRQYVCLASNLSWQVTKNIMNCW